MGRKMELDAGKRMEAVLSLLRREEPGPAIARRYGISENSLYRLRDRFLEAGKAAVAKGTGKNADASRNAEIGQLKRELDEHKRVIGELTIANSILKKLGEDRS
jgi:transposase